MAALVLDRDPDYRELVAMVCARVGLGVECVDDQGELLRRAGAPESVLIVADAADLGGADGVEAVRRRTHAALIVLDGAGRPEEYLEAGADYHIAKPFAPSLLRTTAQAALRRTAAVTPLARERMVIGRVVLEPSRRRLTGERGRLTLTAREADLLEFLAVNTGRVISRTQIIEGAWGGVPEATDAAVVSTVYRLRRKLEESGATARIDTAAGLGYRLVLVDPPMALPGRAGAARTPVARAAQRS